MVIVVLKTYPIEKIKKNPPSYPEGVKKFRF